MMWDLDPAMTSFRFRPVEMRLTVDAEHFVASTVLLDRHLTAGTTRSESSDPFIVLALPLQFP